MKISEYFMQAELAQASYAGLTIGAISDAGLDALRDDAGMSIRQAKFFATNWTVIDQYDGMVEKTYVDEFGDTQIFLDSTGLSVTIFENKDGDQTLAIRGTEISDINDIVSDAVNIAILGTTKYQAQYAALSTKVHEWLNSGVLKSGFSVTGHSLGGFLATGLTAEFGSSIKHTYLYNAPGVDGIMGPPAVEVLKALLVPATVVDTSKISNL